MRLILTRHGETEENKNGILQGQLPGKLTELGMDQARKLSLKLKEEKIDAIYSSDLARASDTAKEIAKFHPNTKLFFVKELREKDQGSFTGKKQTEVDWTNKPSDMESKELMKERARKILKLAYDEYADGTVVFVGHGNINKRVIEVLSEKSDQDIKDIPDFSNASITIIDVKEDGHSIISLNSIGHLQDKNEQR